MNLQTDSALWLDHQLGRDGMEELELGTKVRCQEGHSDSGPHHEVVKQWAMGARSFWLPEHVGWCLSTWKLKTQISLVIRGA